MKKADKDKITEILGVEPIMINSNLLSAQNRKRLYWAGRWNGEKYETVKIEQPKDQGILLRDILEDIPLDDERWKPLDEKYIDKLDKVLREKSLAITASYHKKNAQNYFNKRDGQVIV